MIRVTLMALLGSSLTKALVVHTRINGSAVNFLPCDPTISNCNNKDNLIGCDLEACKAKNCPDGSIAPILPGNCCPDTSLCPGFVSKTSDFTSTNCAAIGCLTELCPNGQIPPVPPGRCCPSALLCPREDCPATCPQAICPDGRTAPTPAGKCCPDAYLCDQERECASKEEFCKPEVIFNLVQCTAIWYLKLYLLFTILLNNCLYFMPKCNQAMMRISPVLPQRRACPCA